MSETDTYVASSFIYDLSWKYQNTIIPILKIFYIKKLWEQSKNH